MKNVHLSQTLSIISDLAFIRDIYPIGSLHSFEPGDEVLLKTQMTASPESQLEGKWTEPWDILFTTPTKLVKLAEIKPWIHHTRVKKTPEEQQTTEPQEDLKVVF